MRGIFATFFATVISLGALAAWFYVAPAEGSGWILFVAFIGCLGVFNSIRKSSLATVFGTIVSAAAGAAWWFHRSLDDSGWVLALAVLCAIGTFNTLESSVSKGTKKAKKESKDENSK